MAQVVAANRPAFGRWSFRAVRFLAPALLLACVLNQQQPGLARTLSPEQRKLQQILAHRHFWTTELHSAQKQERQLDSQLLSTQSALSYQQQRLANEQERAAEQRDQMLSAIQADEEQIYTIRGQLDATRTEYALVHRESAGLLRELRRLKAKIRRELRYVGAAVVQIYELSQVSPLEQVLTAPSLTDLLRQESFVTEIGDRDTAILQQARAQHEAVYRVAKVYIDKMAELRALQGQEKTQLRLVVVETQREDLLLIKAQRLTERRQANIRREEASVNALAYQEQLQLQQTTSAALSDKQMVTEDQQAAEEAAVIIGEETGVYPNVGGPPGILAWPLIGPISQGFGPSPYAFEPPLTYHGVYYAHFHTGIDIAAPFQSPIHAAGAGRVIFAGYMDPGQPHVGYGLCVIISHTPQLATLYAHLDNGMGLRVSVGQVVYTGEVIGYEGMTGNTTGPHLHFEVRINGQFVNPLNYLPPEP